MQYGVEELARAAGVSVDTVRFYQAKRLLPPPARAGRRAVYATRHLERLRRIRRLQRDGLPLGVIRRMLAEPRARASLARALRAERGARSLTRAELAAEAGVPEALVRAVEDAGILEPARERGTVRYTEADVALARTALALLGERLPLAELLALAIHQADATREVVDRAIELFDRHVRRDPRGAERPVDEVDRRVPPHATGRDGAGGEPFPADAGVARPRAARAARRHGRPAARARRHPRRRPDGGHVAVTLPGPAEKATTVRRMFDRIAPRYERLNTVLTLGLDRGWRRAAIAAAAVGPGDLVVDVACGTGDLAALAAASGARVIGVDFAAGMLDHARRHRVPLVRADAAGLPLPAAGRSGRHLWVRAAELRRHPADARGGGDGFSRQAADSSCSRSPSPTARCCGGGTGSISIASCRWVGALLADRQAYAYLPASTAYLPPPPALAAMIVEAGFADVRRHLLGGGGVQLVTARRASGGAEPPT